MPKIPTRRVEHKPSYWTARHRAERQRQSPRLRYVPLDTVDQCEIEDRPAPSAERIHCKCGKTYAGCSVVNDPVEVDEHGECSVARRCYCDHCDHLMIWFEAALPSGTPIGRVISGPGVTKSRVAIERFLKRSPHAAGFLQT